jgi:hypothetical protein
VRAEVMGVVGLLFAANAMAVKRRLLTRQMRLKTTGVSDAQ